MEIKIDIGEGEIRRKALEEANKLANGVAMNVVRAYLAEPNHFNKMGGPGYRDLETMIVNELTSVGFEERVKVMVREALDAAAKEAVERRVKHAAGKAAFEDITPEAG